MSWQYIILLPWVLVLPTGLFLVIRRNYRINSGLCASCGNSLNKDGGCSLCGDDARQPSILRLSLLIAFIIWVFVSFAVLRRFALS